MNGRNAIDMYSESQIQPQIQHKTNVDFYKSQKLKMSPSRNLALERFKSTQNLRYSRYDIQIDDQIEVKPKVRLGALQNSVS